MQIRTIQQDLSIRPLRLHGEEFVCISHATDTLVDNAFDTIEQVLQQSTVPIDLLYTDHTFVDSVGNSQEIYKPDWSPETLLSSNYIGTTFFVRKNLFDDIGGLQEAYGDAAAYDLLLRIVEHTSSVSHVAALMYESRATPDTANEMRALQDALIRRTIPGSVKRIDEGYYSIAFDPDAFTEHVTIVIPIKDRIDLLEPCINSIRKHTIYPHYDILIADNGSTERRTKKYLERESLRVINIATEGFNFSQIINSSVKYVASPLELLLNNDTEAIKPGWLLQMVGSLHLDDHIAACGAKLLFTDGRVQHGGVVLGPHDRTAGHINKYIAGDAPGYQHSNSILRNTAAVTAACMLVRRDAFEEVGGLNEEHLPISYNDVDFCLKLLARGHRIVHDAQAVLFHHEAASRLSTYDLTVEYEARSYLRRSWKPLLQNDPYYNRHFSRSDGCFSPRSAPIGKSILLHSHNLEWQGASLSLFEIASALKQRNYDVEVVADRDGPLHVEYNNHDIPIHVATKGSTDPLASVDKNRFDLIMVNTITAYRYLRNSDITAYPIVWCIRESEREHYEKTLPEFSQELYHLATRLLFVSDATRAVYSDVDMGKCVTIHNGIDVQKIDAMARSCSNETLRSKVGIANDDRVISLVGTICPRKGQKEFTEAALELVKIHPHLTFLMVGGGTNTEYEDEIQKSISHAGMQDRIRIIPTTPDVHQYYAITDIAVCNSSIESFPRVVLEAMAWKLPIVATHVFGIPEQIRDEQEGLLIPPNDPKALCSALQKLIDDPNYAANLAVQARKRVEQHFTLERMADCYEELLLSLHSAAH